MAAGSAQGYTLVTQDLGGGQVNTYAMLPNGDLYNSVGFNPQKPGKKIGNQKDFQQGSLEQKYEAPAVALQKLGYEADAKTVTVGGVKYEYKIDDNGNVQYYQQLHDPATGDSSMEVVTIDTKTGSQHTSTGDFAKYMQEQKRLTGLMNTPDTASSIIANQKNAGGVLQPAGASQALQSAQNIQTTLKVQQLQQAASAQQISQIPAQPLSVQPIPEAPQISVQPLPQVQPLSVQPIPQAPSVSVYQAPITQGTTNPLRVVDRPNTTKVVVR